MSHYSSSTEIIELEDYEVAGLLAAFEPESDDTDPYIVFKKMLKSGHPPDDWDSLFAASKTDWNR